MSFTLQFALQAVLNRLLSSIRSLGIIVHMFLISLSYPLNCLTFFGQLFNLISFNLIPTNYIFKKVFMFPADQDSWLTDWFYWVGYNSMLSINNMATLFLIVASAPVLITFLALANRFVPLWKILPSKASSAIQRAVTKTL